MDISYKYTNDPIEAQEFVDEITQHSLFAADFEAAVKYSPEDIEAFKERLQSNTLSKRQRIDLEAKTKATALDHPYHVDLTHCSIATSEDYGFVFIIDSEVMLDFVLDFLTTTKIRQLWHNASFDFKHIYYHTNKFPILYEDTQICAKTMINHVDVWRANTKLKELMGHHYGDWGISADYFTKAQIYDEKLLKYTAIDACATFKLWAEIQEHIKEEHELSTTTA